MKQLAVLGLCGIILVSNSAVMSGCARWDALRESLRAPQTQEPPVEAQAQAQEPEVEGLSTEPGSKLRIVQKSKAADVLEYLAAFQSLSSERQTEEYRKVAKLFETRQSDLDRFRFSLVLLSPGKGFSNSLKGRNLLEEYLRKEQDPEADLVALARLLVRMVEQREKLEEQLAREKENSDALARQLNELKNIEDIMKKREVDGLPGIK